VAAEKGLPSSLWT